MKQLFLFLALAAFLLPSQVFSQSKTEMRAKEGANVMLVINYVKAEAKQDYETFMEDVFYKAVDASKLPKMKEQDLQTRWLTPARQNEDGTWTYVFLMDPVVEGASYSFEMLFEENNSKEEAAALIKKHDAYMAAPPEFHFLVQSKH